MDVHEIIVGLANDCDCQRDPYTSDRKNQYLMDLLRPALDQEMQRKIECK